MAWPQEYRSETYCLMKLTARPWCLDFTLHGHSFHDLSDGFFPFLSRASADCDPSSTIRYPRKLFTERKRIGRSRLENICSERKKVFFKIGDWKAWMIRIVGQKTSSLDRAYLICSSLLRGRHSTVTRRKVASREKGRGWERKEMWKMKGNAEETERWLRWP